MDISLIRSQYTQTGMKGFTSVIEIRWDIRGWYDVHGSVLLTSLSARVNTARKSSHPLDASVVRVIFSAML